MSSSNRFFLGNISHLNRINSLDQKFPVEKNLPLNHELTYELLGYNTRENSHALMISEVNIEEKQ